MDFHLWMLRLLLRRPVTVPSMVESSCCFYSAFVLAEGIERYRNTRLSSLRTLLIAFSKQLLLLLLYTCALTKAVSAVMCLHRACQLSSQLH